MNTLNKLGLGAIATTLLLGLNACSGMTAQEKNTAIGAGVGAIGGAILTETIFSWPGIGSYIYEGILNRDYPVVQAGVLVVATSFVLINLIVDLSYALLDPRIQYR